CTCSRRRRKASRTAVFAPPTTSTAGADRCAKKLAIPAPPMAAATANRPLKPPASCATIEGSTTTATAAARPPASERTAGPAGACSGGAVPSGRAGHSWDLQEDRLRLLPHFLKHAGHLRRKDDLAWPVLRVGDGDLPEGGEGGVPVVAEQLGGAEIREGLQPLDRGKGVARRAGEAATQDGGGLVVVQALIRPHPLREQVAGGLLGGDAARRQREQRDQEHRKNAAYHGVSSRRTMSVILSCWPEPISNVRSYGWKPSRSTRSECVPGQTGRSFSGTVPTICPSRYTLPQGNELTYKRPSSMRPPVLAGGGVGFTTVLGGAVCVTRGA